MDLIPTRHRPNHENRSSDGIGRGMEFAVLTLLFVGVGYLLDRWLDTKPVFMIVLVVVAVVGQFASLYYSYDERMKTAEKQRAEGAQRGGGTVG
ncbi:MAG: AtpZ/AtpI family protein [Ilumatobacteraceae bacterium]